MSLSWKLIEDARWETWARVSGIVWLALFSYTVFNVAWGPGYITEGSAIYNGLMVVAGIWLVVRPSKRAVLLGLLPAAMSFYGLYTIAASKNVNQVGALPIALEIAGFFLALIAWRRWHDKNYLGYP